MTHWALHAALGLGNAAVAITSPDHWIAIVCAFAGGALIVSAAHGYVIKREDVDHEPY